MDTQLKISVRAMVEFLLRDGDIDARRIGGATDAMQEGSRIHRMIQKRMGAEYEAEVPLRTEYSFGEYSLLLDGRADGIIRRDGRVTIDEIKGTYGDLGQMSEPVGVHLAQAKCYAYMLLTEENLDEIGVRMTYVNMDTEEIRYYISHYTSEEITTWFENVMKDYKRWMDIQLSWREERQSSIAKLQFPYAYREGQKELMENVYKTIYHGKKLFVQAPTGVGKTLSCVYPSVLAMGKGMVDRIFYLTAKTVTGSVAFQAFEILRQSGLKFKSIQITAKEKVCMAKTCECVPENCPYARGHFDRVNDALYDLLTSEVDLNRDLLAEYAQKHMVCPFEFTLDASLFADGIVCDYNYLFDPHVYLKRFFSDGARAGNQYQFLIDEAHNLLERGREMYSASLTKESFLSVKRVLNEDKVLSQRYWIKRITKGLDKCNKELLNLKRNSDGFEVDPNIDRFIGELNLLNNAMNGYMDERDTNKKDEEFLELYFNVNHFLETYDCFDSHYVKYAQLKENGEFFVKLFCVDPGERLKECMTRGRSSILYSATFLPIQYYKGLLGGTKEDYEVYAHSIFDPSKRGIFIGNDVTTKYTRRNPKEYERIASYILEVVKKRVGNYMVFFPSYQMMTDVSESFEMLKLGDFSGENEIEVLEQNAFMHEEEREEFLGRFTENCKDKTLVGFCVQGGIFSEGIDLKGDALIGAIIVGTGLPQVSKERELLKTHFEESEGDGFDYAYRYPGMNKVLQSAGRVIRTAEDVGVVVLLDERFLQGEYRRLFPREWEEIHVVNTGNVGEEIERFWKEKL